MCKICYIVGALPVTGKLFIPSANDLVIAADAGYRTLDEHGIRCDLTVGDFDSAPRPDRPGLIALDPIKDDTDTMYAVKQALALGCKRFYLYGVTGGRLDQTIASLQTLTYLLDHGAKGMLIADGYAAIAVRHGKVIFDPGCRGVFSVFSFDNVSRGVNIESAKYKLHNATLTNGFPLGVSNEFIGSAATVSVHEGTLHILFECGDARKAVTAW